MQKLYKFSIVSLHYDSICTKTQHLIEKDFVFSLISDMLNINHRASTALTNFKKKELAEHANECRRKDIFVFVAGHQKKSVWKRMVRYKSLYLFILPAVIYLAIFHYGLCMAY